MKIVKIEEIEYTGYIYTPQVLDNENYILGESKIVSKNCQNFDVPSIRTIFSRAGKNNIILALGSNNQIDSKFLTVNNNALTFLINKCGNKNEHDLKIKGVKLTNVLRSKISEWSDEELIQK